MADTYAPLPRIAEDPDVLAAERARMTYQESFTAIYADQRLSALAQAEQVDALWRSVYAYIADRQQHFLEARHRRLQQLSALMPIGPNIPDGTSPADAAALQAAFRLSYVEAREATVDELQAMYTDADRFGDDTLLRAVLTVASDASYGQVTNRWTEGQPPPVREQLEEAGKIRDLFSGASIDSLLYFKAFQKPEQPEDSLNLPTIQANAAAFEESQRRAVATRASSFPGYISGNRPIPSELN